MCSSPRPPLALRRTIVLKRTLLEPDIWDELKEKNERQSRTRQSGSSPSSRSRSEAESIVGTSMMTIVENDISKYIQRDTRRDGELEKFSLKSRVWSNNSPFSNAEREFCFRSKTRYFVSSRSCSELKGAKRRLYTESGLPSFAWRQMPRLSWPVARVNSHVRQCDWVWLTKPTLSDPVKASRPLDQETGNLLQFLSGVTKIEC